MLKIVLHRLDGTLIKGTTTDFSQARESFHVNDNETGQVTAINTGDLKAIFFVKSFEGDPRHIERTDVERTGLGRKIKVRFKDGETIFGYTTGYNPGRPAFFVFPCDPDSNNDRVFVLNHSTEDISFV
jgi:hypothetical protein